MKNNGKIRKENPMNKRQYKKFRKKSFFKSWKKANLNKYDVIKFLSNRNYNPFKIDLRNIKGR